MNASTTTTKLILEDRKKNINRSDDNISLIGYDDENKIISESSSNISFQSRNNSNSSQLPLSSRLEMLTDFFDIPPSPLSSLSTLQHKSGVVLASKSYISGSNKSRIRNAMSENRSNFRNHGWVVPCLIIATILLILMVLFELFVLFKTRKTTSSRRHLFLGQILLLGIFSSTGLSILVTTIPTSLSCSAVAFGVGFSFSIIFSSCLVKLIFLISLNNGIYLPAIYQFALFFFAVLTQISISFQRLISEISQTNRFISKATHCKTYYSNSLRASFCYIDFLICVVTILAMKSRGIRDNYRESTYIAISLSLVIPSWLGFSVTGFVVHEENKDMVLAFELLAISAIIFFVMFMPKGRHLAAMGRRDIFLERDEKLSVSSRGSLSFFHFKPIKYGVITSENKQQTEIINEGFLNDQGLDKQFEPTQHSSNPNVYFQRSNVMIY